MNYRPLLLLASFLICVVLAVVVNLLFAVDIVYTHLFYIPIILTGIWYPRYALLMAAALGLIHIACDHASSGKRIVAHGPKWCRCFLDGLYAHGLIDFANRLRAEFVRLGVEVA